MGDLLKQTFVYRMMGIEEFLLEYLPHALLSNILIFKKGFSRSIYFIYLGLSFFNLRILKFHFPLKFFSKNLFKAFTYRAWARSIKFH